MPALRNARPTDLEEVESLLAGAGLPRDGVSSSLGNFIVARSDGETVGAIGLEDYGEYALLRSAVVAPRWRGRRLGSELTRELVERARREGRSALFLLTTTAEEFFPLFGFERIAREEVPAAVRESVEFRGACPDSAAVMRLTLR